MFVKLKILIAPLDWGLGHTTRCLPIISYLLSKGHALVVAASGASERLLKENFPQVECIPLQGYNIKYSRYNYTFSATIALQIPRILNSIKKENAWLKEQQQKYHFDLIISDNRYGLHLAGVKSIIMTHQLHIKTGMGPRADGLLRRLHYKFLDKFSECWIVDEAEGRGLSGDLAHPERLPQKAKYIGWLSQLALYPDTGGKGGHNSEKEILVLLSGPEPLRGILENRLLQQIRETASNYHFVFVAGNPLGTVPHQLPENVTYFTHLNAERLRTAMASADLVICRSGYSTLMDLALMQKKALLVPTPGQTEQEYLAAYFLENAWFYYENQKDLLLFEAIAKAFQYPGISGPVFQPHHLMKSALDAMINEGSLAASVC